MSPGWRWYCSCCWPDHWPKNSCSGVTRFSGLVEAIGPGGAIVVFSVLFGLVHLTNPGASFWGLLDTVVIGIVLSLAYLRTRALWLPWGFHFAWNATLGLVFGLPVSGLRLFNAVIHTTANGPRWLTGGAYGLEASLPGALVVLLALLIVWRAPLMPLVDPYAFFPARKLVEGDSADAAATVPPPSAIGLIICPDGVLNEPPSPFAVLVSSIAADGGLCLSAFPLGRPIHQAGRFLPA